MKNIVPQGRNVIKAHLRHLKDHFQTRYLNQAISFLKEQNAALDLIPEFLSSEPSPRQCPGSKTFSFAAEHSQIEQDKVPSQLSHWPVQLHLISPMAQHYRDSDLLVAADCVAYALGDFHNYLRGKTLAIACPKLDSRQETYIEKLTALIDHAQVRSIKIMIMQVPCCSGLLRHAVEAASRARTRIPVSCVIVGLRGEILRETPVQIENAVASSQ